MKSKVMIIHTGGTIAQEEGADGIFRPSDRDYMTEIKGLDDLADIHFIRAANLDSTNMQTEDRAKIARLIFDNHLKYDGFVVVHGTDTMAETASSLNYMIQNLGKPIVLTGAQRPIFGKAPSDGIPNMYFSTKAATMDLGEIVIGFGDKILRGNRSIKISEQGLNAFASPRVEPVGEIGIDLMLSETRIRRYNGDPVLFTEFDTNIEFYQQSSGTDTFIFKRYAEDSNIHGIVISGFGAGNIQARLVAHIISATQEGKPVLVVTNCVIGAADMGIYEVGSVPLKAGAISAGDLTMEAATQKLMYAVGRANKMPYSGTDRLGYVKSLIQRDYGRDITVVGNRFGKN